MKPVTYQEFKMFSPLAYAMSYEEYLKDWKMYNP